MRPGDIDTIVCLAAAPSPRQKVMTRNSADHLHFRLPLGLMMFFVFLLMTIPSHIDTLNWSCLAHWRRPASPQIIAHDARRLGIPVSLQPRPSASALWTLASSNFGDPCASDQQTLREVAGSLYVT